MIHDPHEEMIRSYSEITDVLYGSTPSLYYEILIYEYFFSNTHKEEKINIQKILFFGIVFHTFEIYKNR